MRERGRERVFNINRNRNCFLVLLSVIRFPCQFFFSFFSFLFILYVTCFPCFPLLNMTNLKSAIYLLLSLIINPYLSLSSSSSLLLFFPLLSPPSVLYPSVSISLSTSLSLSSTLSFSLSLSLSIPLSLSISLTTSQFRPTCHLFLHISPSHHSYNL